MLQRCRDIINQDSSNTPVELMKSDILDFTINNASVVVMNFTLQFIEREQRRDLMQRIYDGMLPGGIMIPSEKICFEKYRKNKPNLAASQA